MPSFSSASRSGWPARRKRILFASLMSLVLVLTCGAAGAYALLPQLSGNARSLAKSFNGQQSCQSIGQGIYTHNFMASKELRDQSTPTPPAIIPVVGTLQAQLFYCPNMGYAYGSFSYTPGSDSDLGQLPSSRQGLCFITTQNVDFTKSPWNSIDLNNTDASTGCSQGVSQGQDEQTKEVSVSPGDTWTLCWRDSLIQTSSGSSSNSPFALLQPDQNQSWCSTPITIPSTPSGTPIAGSPTATAINGTPITGSPTATAASGTPIAGSPTPISGTPAPTVGSGTDPASLRQDCHTDIIAQGATPPFPNLPYSYPVGSPLLLTMGNGTLTGQLYYCPRENSVFGIFSVNGTSTTGSCSLKASYGTISQSKHIDTVYNKTSPYVYGICSSQTDQFTITPDNSGSRQQQTMLGETYSGDTWQLCWETQPNNAQCSSLINPFA